MLQMYQCYTAELEPCYTYDWEANGSEMPQTCLFVTSEI